MNRTSEISITNVLFVCTANRCRSVMAEWGFRDLAARMEVWEVTSSSAGIAAVPGSPPTENTLSVLSERGIDATAHRATLIDRHLIEDAGIVLVMTRAHLAAITDLCPDAAVGKAFLLGRFLPVDGEREIDDPYGLDLDGYRRCFAAIRSCFGNLMEYIQGDMAE